MPGAGEVADVVIVGAGPSGAVAAHTLAINGFKFVCLEQGDWQSPAEFPGNHPEYELLLQQKVELESQYAQAVCRLSDESG